MSLAKRVILLGAAITTIMGASSVIACNSNNDVEPTAIVTPIQSPTPTLEDKVTPTPEASTTPTPTFKDDIFKKLQEYNSKNPLEVYSSQSLDKMISFAESNKTLVSDYDGRHFYILTEFLKDNPVATNHPVAVDEYIREIDDMIFDYCEIENLDKKIEGYGNVKYAKDVKVRDMVNLNWSNFLPFIESGKAKDGEYRLLYPAIFNTDLTNRIIEYEVDPNKYNHNIKELRQNLIEVAYKNITNFQQIRNNALKVAGSDDYSVEVSNGAYTNARVLTGSGGNLWPNSTAQAWIDTKALLKDGSKKAKTALKIYAYDETIGGKSMYAESRVELAIGDLWALPEYGIKPYRIGASGHGELAFDITEDDLKLMQRISNEPFLVLPSPYGGLSTNIMWTRIELVKKDGIREIKYPNYAWGGWMTLIELK